MLIHKKSLHFIGHDEYYLDDYPFSAFAKLHDFSQAKKPRRNCPSTVSPRLLSLRVTKKIVVFSRTRLASATEP